MSLAIRLPRLTLPHIQFVLPKHVGKADGEHYRKLSERLETLAHTAGTHSPAYRERKERLHASLHAGKRVQEVVRTPKDIRPLVEVWRACDRCINRNPIDRATLEHFTRLRQKFSVLVLFAFGQLFFERFDRLGDTHAFAAFIRKQFRLNAERKFSQTLTRFAQQADSLFTVRGPEWVVEQARKERCPLETVADRLGLPMEREGRFFTKCKHLYYLRTLQGLRVGQDHDVLRELVQKDVYESSYDSDWQLGHKVIHTMVDKATGHQEMPDNWLRVILSIAGDPRVSTRASNYVRWWARLGSEYVRQVRQWLSWVDTGLFLKILEDYTRQSSDPALNRMFPARKRFLEGVFKKELVRGTRLFLSRQAERYVRRHYKKNDIPAYSRVEGGPLAVIYLNIDGNHVVEGTHSFSLRIYRRLPRQNPIEDYDLDTVPSRALGIGLWEDYRREFGQTGAVSIVHHPNSWQNKAIRAFREFGTVIDPSDVLEDSRAYRSRYGV